MSSSEPFLPLQRSDAEAPRASDEPTGGPFRPDSADQDDPDVFLPEDSDGDADSDADVGVPPPTDSAFRTPTGQAVDPADD